MKSKSILVTSFLFFLYFLINVISRDVFKELSSKRSHNTAILIMVIAVIFLAPLWRQYLISEKSRKIKSFLKQIQIRDPRWYEDKILDSAKYVFFNLYEAWNSRDLSRVKNFLSSELYKGWERELNASRSRSEHHKFIEPSLKSIKIIEIKTQLEASKDCFTVLIKGIRIEVIKENSKEIRNKKDFVECWSFEWEENCWKLYKVNNLSGLKKFIDIPF